MENDIITSAIAILSTIATGGVAAVAAKLKRGLAPLAAQRAVKVCICAPTEASRLEAAAYRRSLIGAGYKHVSLTHGPASATGCDIVLLWKPAVDAAAAIAEAIRVAAPLSYLCLYTLDRLPIPLDERMMLSNSPLRLRADLATVAEVVAAESVG